MIKVAIIGRPNVGKSTLFNRILGFRKAITEDLEGVTRDYVSAPCEWRGKRFILIDTGGFDTESQEGLFPKIRRQIEGLLEDVDLVIFVLDGKDGLMPQDMEIATILRRKGKPVLYVVNKVDSKRSEEGTFEFFRLGVERLYPVSALHGKGIEDLLEATSNAIEDVKEEEDKNGIRIAIVGRPNTGKSSVLNAMLGKERVIVSEIPGTTRDAIDTKLLYQGTAITLIDTAGIRRKSRVSGRLEAFSISSTINTIERAHVVNIILDAVEGVSHQDRALVHLVTSRGKGICVVINKWDLVQGRIDEATYKAQVKESLPHARFAPILCASAKTGKNIMRILELDLRIYRELGKWIKTSELNRAIQQMQGSYSTTLSDGRDLKILYGSQVKDFPPTFLFFTNTSQLPPEQYRRYLENSMRKRFGFEGAPLKLLFRKRR